MSFYDVSNFYPDTSIGYLMRVCNQLSYASLDQLFAAEGVTGAQWSALISLHFGRADTCAALARDMAHDKGAMTRMMDQMEAKGWVDRRRDADDRRHVRLSITDTGRDVAMRCRERLIDCWNAWLRGWSDEEVSGLIAQLQRLRRTMEETPACAA